MATVTFIPDKKNKLILKALGNMKNDMDNAQKSSLSSSGFAMSRSVQFWMKSRGNEIWPKIHPFTKTFQKLRAPNKIFGQGLLFGDTVSLKKRDDFFAEHLPEIGLFAKYIVDRTKQVRTGFAFKSDPSRFDPKMMKAVSKAEKKQITRVTPKMRRFFAAATEQAGGRNLGVDFFPLRKARTQLINPARKTEEPLSKIIAPKIFPFWGKKFSKSLGRKNLFADKEFLKGESAAKDKMKPRFF